MNITKITEERWVRNVGFSIPIKRDNQTALLIVHGSCKTDAWVADFEGEQILMRGNTRGSEALDLSEWEPVETTN